MIKVDWHLYTPPGSERKFIHNMTNMNHLPHQGEIIKPHVLEDKYYEVVRMKPTGSDSIIVVDINLAEPEALLFNTKKGYVLLNRNTNTTG